MPKDRIISGIDIGSSKVCTIIASQNPDGPLSIIGVSTVPSKGIKKGVVVDIDQAVEAIAESLEGAERMAGYTVASAFVTVNGNHITSLNSHGVVAISSPDGEISQSDIQRVTEAARAISIPSSREIIHVVPKNFIVDTQEGVHDPAGMSGVRLEVETHIISGAAMTMRNLVRCVQQVGVEVEDLVFTGLASAESTLTDTEKELGVVLLDIGGGTTNMTLYLDGAVAYSAVLAVGGKNITNDIAIGLRVSLEDAEKIKMFISRYREPSRMNVSSSEEKTAKQAREDAIKEDALDITDLRIGELKTISRKFVVEGIIRPRLREIFDLVAIEIKKSGYAGLLPAGIVLCGGASQTVGMAETIKDSLRVPVRIAQPKGASGLIEEVTSPAYAASVGTIIYGSHVAGDGKRGPMLKGLPGVGGIFGKLGSFFKGFMP
jgi:cell division protein FtsA